ncbi:cysteine proteinase [Dichomitus squalens LYAD-421 SS1]|uniref:ubiquitinyl hydrolase 1 n=1 Tax=Dichomitus squalens TaxID=114155 RepID=A0A4Q9PF88_9APHY|nr:cysteine proteinase [Dichomitus squalens LYAD-421 SS1]EJF67507.1 cysteine proteinase [Dichomitus squalens LYAD-421 SS1]TBU53599.1 cysteine proteinase [Dichomitus squalens]
MPTPSFRPSTFAVLFANFSSNIQTLPFPTFRRSLPSLPYPYPSQAIPSRPPLFRARSPSALNPHAPPAIPIPPSPPTLFSALRSLFLHISRNPADKGTVAPKAFIDKLKELNEIFRPAQHQDAHEFLNYLLNRIMEDMEDDGRKLGSNANGVEKSGEDLSTSIATLSTQPAPSTSTAQATAYHSTIVHRLFEGVLTSETRCLTCETVSSRDESFIDLSIDIEQNSSVTACLRQFSASEMLCQKNKFFCDSCCDLQEAEKRMKIKKLPNVLALHLKRFKYQEDLGKYIKLAYRVAFPLELRLFNTVDDAEDPDRLYELFAIVVHIGNGPHHGHYVTIIKARGVWTLFDDDSVSTVKESDIPKYFGDSNSGTAYVLYYQAVDIDLAALGLKSASPPPGSRATTDLGSVPGKPVGIATTEPSEQSHTPISPSLQRPPGLHSSVDDLNLSDKSDSPLPTPGAAQPISSTNNTSDSLPVIAPTPSYPNLVVSVPDGPPTPGPMSPSREKHSHGTFGKALKTLRQTPSLRLKTPNGKDGYRRSVTDSSANLLPLSSTPASPRTRRPQTTETTATASTTETSTHETVPSVPSSPLPSKGYAFPNGTAATRDKERTPEKKSSTWFRRKSTREETMPVASPSLSRLGRRGSEAAISGTSSPAIPSSPVPPFASGSRTDPPFSPSSHKKSAPDLSKSVRREKRASGNASSKLPPRPSTAGATMTSSSRGYHSGVGVPPPLPTLPGSPMTPGKGTAADSFFPPKRKERDAADGSPRQPEEASLPPLPSTPAGDSGRERQREAQSDSVPPPARISQSDSQYSSTTYSHSNHTSHTHGHARPGPPGSAYSEPDPYATSLSFGRSGGGGVGDTPVVPHSSSSSSSTGNNWKRATRKLSLTAPNIFGKKDRERKEVPPPSAFAR